MLSFSDHALVIAVSGHAESSAILTMLTHKHGLYKGVVRGAFSKKNRGIYQIGNLVEAVWSARIAEHIGSIKAELISPFAAHIMQHSQALAILSSACSLLSVALPERHSYPKIYASLVHLINHLANRHDSGLHEYIKFEMTLLAESGFGLDLTSCAATGTRDNLRYISPKSGRAVSAEAGEAYKDKLFPLVLALKPDSDFKLLAQLNNQQAKEALSVTSYFLENWLFSSLNIKIPPARNRLLAML